MSALCIAPPISSARNMSCCDCVLPVVAFWYSAFGAVVVAGFGDDEARSVRTDPPLPDFHLRNTHRWTGSAPFGVRTDGCFRPAGFLLTVSFETAPTDQGESRPSCS